MPVNTLLSELDQIAVHQEELKEKAEQRIQEVIHKCTETMRAGSIMFNINASAAESIWQVARSLKAPDVVPELLHMNVQVTLPPDLLHRIDNHGAVVTEQDTTSYPAVANTTFSTSSSSTPPDILLASPFMDFVEPSIILSTSVPSARLITPVPISSNVPSHTADAPSKVQFNTLPISDTPANTLAKRGINSPATPSTKPDTNILLQLRIKPSKVPYTTCLPSLRSRRFDVVEKVTTVAGYERGLKDGNMLHACFDYPWGICINPNDERLYICDRGNNAIRTLTKQGDVGTFGTVSSSLAFMKALILWNTLKQPSAVVMNYKENVFFVSNNGSRTISKITSSGDVSWFAGSGREGNADGVAIEASFNCPNWLALDQKTGTLFVSDFDSHMIRKVTHQGEVSTLAGSPECGCVDGEGRAAKFKHPQGICYDEATQSVIVCDYGNNRLRRVHPNGDVTTMCLVDQPLGVVMAGNRTILVSSRSDRIHKVTQNALKGYDVGVLTGSGAQGREDGRADACSFNYPSGMVVDEATHSCFVVDYGNHLIRKISFVD